MSTSRPYLLALLASALVPNVEAIPQNDAVALCAASPGQFKCLSKTKFVICNGANSVAQDVAPGTECVDDAIVRAAAGSIAATIAASSTPALTSPLSTAEAPKPSVVATTSLSTTSAAHSATVVATSANLATTSVPKSALVIIPSTTTSIPTSPAPKAPSLQTASMTLTTTTLHSVDEVLSFLASYPSQYPPAALTVISSVLQPAITNVKNGTGSAGGATVMTLQDPKDVISVLASNTSAYPPATLQSISNVLMPTASTIVGATLPSDTDASTLTMTVKVTGTTTVYSSATGSIIAAPPVVSVPSMGSSARTKRGCKPALPNQSGAVPNSASAPGAARTVPLSTPPAAQAIKTTTQPSPSALATTKFPIISTIVPTAKSATTSPRGNSVVPTTSAQTSHTLGGTGVAASKGATSPIPPNAPQDFASPTGAVSQLKVVPVSV